MNKAPKWFVPVAVLALIWNLIGCAAFYMDLTITPEQIAGMDAASQALYAHRPAWSMAAYGIAVILGALGSLGLVLRKRWSMPLLVLSLIGVIVMDFALFVMSGVRMAPLVYAMQIFVLLIALGLVLMSNTGIKRQWLN